VSAVVESLIRWLCGMVGMVALIGAAAQTPPPPVLGRAGNVRLNRMTVLRRGRPGRGCGFAVGLQPLTE